MMTAITTTSFVLCCLCLRVFQDKTITFYHAQCDPEVKMDRHLKWSRGEIKIICATIAFGMGINKPDVRWVIHYSMSKTITGI
jgi:superfamily II DNA helicase RecQ